jgi:hypothetical protein
MESIKPPKGWKRNPKIPWLWCRDLNVQDMCSLDGPSQSMGPIKSRISTGPTTLPSMKGKPGDAISDLFIEPEKANGLTIGSGSSGSSGPDIVTGLVVNVIWWLITSAFGASGRSGDDNSGGNDGKKEDKKEDKKENKK